MANKFGPILEYTKYVGRYVEMLKSDVLSFPIDLVDSKRPYIRFVCEPYETHESIKSIQFPCPSGITFSESGNYGVFDMGTLGTILPAILSGEGNAAQKAGAAVVQEARDLGIAGAIILAAKTAGRENEAMAMEFAVKQVRNPRTNAAFSANTLRNYQFTFKMIGRNLEEVKIIDRIQNIFREQVYAAKLNRTSSFMLKYPNQWTITFVDPKKPKKELDYIPKIYTCNLQGVTTVVNSTSNTFRKDMSPYEIDISLQFQETKILTRDEIILLEDGDRTNEQDEAFKKIIGSAESKVQGIIDKNTRAEEWFKTGYKGPPPP